MKLEPKRVLNLGRSENMASTSSAHVLMKKGKRAAATYVLSECAQTPTPKNLNELLDLILQPNKPIDEWETIDWCKWLMAGGRTPDEFSAIVHGYDNATTCGLVWTANFVAYRCRTCSISPCMSLCSECFQRGNHDGHDFNMFRSQAGGACDCGDTSVMKETGFCQRHGPKAQVNKASAPGDLLCVAEAMMPRIILRLIQHLRQHSHAQSNDEILNAIKEADTYLTMLHDFSAMGAAMRRVMTGALTNPQVYKNLTDHEAVEPRGAGKEIAEFMKESKRIYEEAVKSLPNPEPPHEYKDCPSLQEHLVHQTFLEELVFWTVKFEFPQKTVCLLLNMLPDSDYKECLTQAFVLHYSRISMMLENSTDPDALSNRVVHVSVQLFSNESLAMRMAEKLHLLHVMVISLKYMMSKILIQNTLHDPDKNFHYVVDCAHNVMKDHCYWPLVSDLNNVLSHKGVALKFMSEDSLLDMWFAFLSMFQGMNVNKRETTQHIEFEPNTYYAAFSAELEASAYPMWSMVSHLNDPELLPYTKRVLKNCLAAIQEWLDAINFTPESVVDSSKVSFHLPLHRYFSVFMCQAIKQQKMSLSEILPPPETLHLMMMHPLRVQVAFYEILAGKWVRNGLQIKGQAMTYIQCNFCNSMVDADIYLLQICATQLPPSTFLQTVLDNFQVNDWLSLSPYNSNNIFIAKHNDQMLESFLTFLSILMSVRTNLGLTDVSLIQLEMVTLLCMGDKTHSQLLELMPERCGNYQGRDFESELSEVAHYRQPNLEASGNMQQGMYAPRPHVWENMYDPVHILLRAVHRRDFQSSMDNYTEYARQTGQIKTGSSPWPPYRKPSPVSEAYEDPRKLLNCKTLHAVIFSILLRALKAPNVPEQILSLAVFLLEMAIDIAEPQNAGTEICQNFTTERKQIFDLDFQNWFETDWLSANLRTQIDVISLPEENPDLTTPEPQVVNMLALEEESQLNQMAVVPAGMSFQTGYVTGYPPLMAGNELVPVSSVATYYPPAPASCPGYSSHPMRALESGQSESTPMQLEMMALGNVDSSSSSDDDVEKEEHRKLVQSESGVKYKAVFVGESIISLLLKLHSTLSGVPDSFDLNDSEPPPPVPVPNSPPHPASNSRIGDGPFFIAKLLYKIAKLDPMCREFVSQTKEKVWPKTKSEEELEAKEAKEREERRRRAKERQQKLMAEFATKQRQFMEKAKETEGSEMDWLEEDNTVMSKMEYDCVICSQSSPSTEEKPMGLVVLLQASSIIGHRKRSPEPESLPITEEDRLIFAKSREHTLASDFVKRGEQLLREFDNAPWQLALNLGCESGVHVQTCGHHIHLECLMPYLNSLRSQQRQQSLAVDRGEYACPLCRQLANSVLPLSPELGDCSTLVRSRTTCMSSIATEISTLLSENPPAGRATTLPMQEAMSRAMEDMAKITDGLFRFYHNFGSPPSPECLVIFVSSIVRTNLEIDVTQRGGTLCTQSEDVAASTSATMPKRSCLVPLLHVLGMHAKTLATWPEWQTWQQVAGIVNKQTDQAVAKPKNKEVPLLLKDPSALLTQFVLLLPMRLEQSHFTCVIKCLYNLLYFESLLQIICSMSEKWRTHFRNLNAAGDVTTLEGCISLLAVSLHQGQLFMDDTELGASARDFDKSEVESELQSHCLPFLRIAALLRHYLYGEELPDIASEQREFVRLVYYLELVTDGMEWCKFNAAVALSWVYGDGTPTTPTAAVDTLAPITVVTHWCEELLVLAAESQVASRNLVRHHQRWHPPRLLRLPDSYDKIFQYYHRRQCVKCHSVPRETSVCLLCGTIVCLKENCCKQQEICEAVQHSIKCGAGTAMFLVVTSSYIIVIRGRRACLWGSVYLDSFGEEDRDLKRGKPLYLSAGRYQLLEQQWLSHRFDHTNKKWVWHRDAL